MTSRSVPRVEWFQFFDEFTRRHRNAPATVMVFGEGRGIRSETRTLPLNGIMTDRSAKTLSIGLGGPDSDSADHDVEHPVRVWIEMMDGGEEVALAIESESGVQTVVEVASGRTAGT